MPILVKRLLAALVIVLLLIAINQYMSDEGLFGFGVPPYYARLIVLAGINIILAVSLNLITGFTGQFSIGHAGFMAVGAYSSAYLTVYYAQTWEHSLAGIVGATLAHVLIFLLAILVGSIVAALAGLIVGIPSLRLRGDYLAIVTLGFAEIIRIVILNIDKVGGATGFTVPGYTNFLWVGAFAVITIVIVYNIVHSDIGRALVSIREDELAAEAMGINTTRYKVLAFVISSALAGMAGLLARADRCAAALAALIALFAWKPEWLPLEPNNASVRDLALLFGLGAVAYVARDRLPLSLTAFAVGVALFIVNPWGLGRGLAFTLTIAYGVLVLAYHPRIQWRAYNRVGDYSYGVYVYAFPIQQTIVARVPGLTPIELFAASFAVTLALAAVSWHALERPALALKAKFRDRGDRLRTGAATP